MYQTFYGLEDLPFELTPNPKYLFLTPQHSEALGNLQYGLASAKPITMLIGEAGAGKTTILQTALESASCRAVRSVYLNNPRLTRDEFMGFLARRFDLGPDATASKSVLIAELERKLLAERSAGWTTALVIDEAQGLSDELLEEVRLLANLEESSRQLLPLVVAGQPELATRLQDPALRQFKQRVALRCEIALFDAPQTASYVATRLRRAGGDPARLFTREAIRLVHERSGGVPRTISVICDNALVTGFALERRPIDRQIVLEVCQGLELNAKAANSAGPVAQASSAPEPRPSHAPQEPDAPGAEGDADGGSGLFGYFSRPRRFRLGSRVPGPAALQGRVR